MKVKPVKAMYIDYPSLTEELRTIFQAYLLILLLITSFFTISTGIGTSMGSTFGHGDLMFSLNTGKTYSPIRGDIVAFIPPMVVCSKNGNVVQFQKRVIGLPGDRVEIQDNRTFINGVELKESYAEWDAYTLPEDDPSSAILCDNTDVAYENAMSNCVFGCDPSVRRSWTVPAGNVFVMGDGRYGCADSRAFGFVPIENIEYVNLLQFWPLNRIRFLRNQTY